MKQTRRVNPLQWLLIAGAVFLLVFLIIPKGPGGQDIDISEVIARAQTGGLRSIEIQGDTLAIVSNDGESFVSRKEPGVSIVELLEQRGVATGEGGVDVTVKAAGMSFFTILITFLPIILIGVLIFVLMRRTQGGINQAMSVGRSKAKQVTEDRPPVRFADVAGADEAKQELQEVVEFLSQPTKFTSLGAKIPTGVLLVGPPGTGKTLISKAVAGEAGVPFFSTSGSEFVEMFVGVGASRVRDLFSRAKRNAPSVVFIDEIDAVGRHRGAGIGGGNDEREQTLNQILVEMDGFDANTSVIVIAATNRPDILDPALIRPGRFDRRVMMDPPDVRGRKEILDVHLQGKPVSPEVSVETIARETVGFSGADLANLVNEAAILTARANKKLITTIEFEEAVDRVIAGPARKSRKISEHEKLVVAYHEAGHALVAASLPDADPVHKVTIVARGQSGGHTRTLPAEDRNLWTRGQFEALLAMMMGGQVAEEVIFGDITTGASSDLQNATNVARKMVTEYGMSTALGPQSFDSGGSQMYMGRSTGGGSRYSNAIAEKIDAEIGKLLGKARDTAKTIIEGNKDRLMHIAQKLSIEETLQGKELQELLKGPTPNEQASPA